MEERASDTHGEIIVSVDKYWVEGPQQLTASVQKHMSAPKNKVLCFTICTMQSTAVQSKNIYFYCGPFNYTYRSHETVFPENRTKQHM